MIKCDQICPWNYYEIGCKKPNDELCPMSNLATKEKPQTNADHIRATDDELATMLHAVKMGYRPWCDYHCENEGDDGCDNCIKKWLQQPAEGE